MHRAYGSTVSFIYVLMYRDERERETEREKEREKEREMKRRKKGWKEGRGY